jgi:hypothetical protein
VKLLLHLLMLDGKVPALFVATWGNLGRGGGRGTYQSTSAAVATVPGYVGGNFVNEPAMAISSSRNPITLNQLLRWGSVGYCNQTETPASDGTDEDSMGGEEASGMSGNSVSAPASANKCGAVVLVGHMAHICMYHHVPHPSSRHLSYPQAVARDKAKARLHDDPCAATALYADAVETSIASKRPAGSSHGRPMGGWPAAGARLRVSPRDPASRGHPLHQQPGLSLPLQPPAQQSHCAHNAH